MRKFILLIGLLAGCAGGPKPPAGPEGSPMPLEDTCGAAPYERLLGQDATALEKVLIMRMVRVIYPDTAVTMDFRAERINFEIGRDNAIARIYCG